MLRALLEREQELVAANEPGAPRLTEDNAYTFAAETAGPGYRYIEIKPKRKDVTLVGGRIVLSEDDAR